jgi:YD repeat-containing protein
LPIPPGRYTATLPVYDDEGNPTGETTPKQTRFAIAWFQDKALTRELFEASLNQVGGETGLDIFPTVEEARQWIRDNTDLVESEPGKFLIREAYFDTLANEQKPAEYLTVA